MKQNKIIKAFLKKYAVLCLTLVLLLGTGLITYAEYVKSSHTSRVVASYAESMLRFSSNFLFKWSDNKHNIETIPIDAVQTAGYNVLIYNYPRGYEGRYYQSNITYDLNAKLMMLKNGEWTPVTGDDFTGNLANVQITVTLLPADRTVIPVQTLSKTKCSITRIQGTLSGDGPHYDTLEIEYTNLPVPAEGDPPINIPFYLEITATPSGACATDPDLAELEGLLGLVHEVSTVQQSWTGKMTEEFSSRNDYDGYNYVIEGNGSGAFTFQWDPDVLTLSEASRLKTLPNGTTVQSATTQDGWKQITLNVNSDTGASRYEIQFYKKNAAALQSLDAPDGSTDEQGDKWSNAVNSSFS